MTDAEARKYVERTDAFIAAFRQLVNDVALEPVSSCEEEHRCALARIAATVDAVDYVTFVNLATLNEAMKGALLSVFRVYLLCVGCGPTLDFADAQALLAELQPAIDIGLKWMRHYGSGHAVL